MDNRKQQLEKMRAIKDKYEPGTVLMGEDFPYALSVLKKSPIFEKKMIDVLSRHERICLMIKEGLDGEKCFCLASGDFQEKIIISFSWKEKETSVEQKVADALREADCERVEKFRDDVPDEFVCPFTNAVVRPYGGDAFEVEHFEKSISEITSEVISKTGADAISKYIETSEFGDYYFIEPLRSKMKYYMESNSKLVYVSSGGRSERTDKDKNTADIWKLQKYISEQEEQRNTVKNV